jgi:hypothetical protein
LIAALEGSGVRLLTECRPEVVRADGVHVRRGTEHEVLEADTVVGIAPHRPQPALAATLTALGHRVHSVGDCDALGFIEGATNGAIGVARSIGEAILPSNAPGRKA